MSVLDSDLTVQGHFSARSMTLPNNAVTKEKIPVGAGVEYTKLQQLGVFEFTQRRRAVKYRALSQWFDLDNGAAATIDDVILVPSEAITVTAAKAIYTDATSGTVAGGNFKIGTSLGGAQIVAATAYENTKAVGTSTAGTIVLGTVAADGQIFVRHTGVAATAAGQVRIQVEYTLDSDTLCDVYDDTIPLHIVFGQTGAAVSIEAMLQTTLPTSSRAHTFDLQYGSPTAGYTSVLSAPLSLSSASTLKTAVAGAVTTPALVAGGSLRLVIASSGTGNNGRGLLVTVRVAEDPSA